MTDQPDFAETLYQILPAYYRSEDKTGDMRAYLAGCGALLDQLYATLRQRHGDNFPDKPPKNAAIAPCQDWLLPYFAELVDATLVSPLVDGKRDELGNAILWRQGKGTLSTMDSIAEAVGQTVAFVQEGYRRTALTARIGQPLRTARSYGYPTAPEMRNPGNAARHPDLPAVMVDVRCPSRALAVDADNPGAQSFTIDGSETIWRQGSIHGAPCFPGSFEDVSRRTVDVRLSDWRVGHFHPKRLLLYLPPPSGFFAPNAPRLTLNAPPSADYKELVDVFSPAPGVITHRNKTLDREHFMPVIVTNQVDLDVLGTATEWRFEGIAFERRIHTNNAKITLRRSAARTVETARSDVGEPVVDMQDSLVSRVLATDGLVRAIACTFLNRLAATKVEVSDCLFEGRISDANAGSGTPAAGGCVRYSKIIPDQASGAMTFIRNTRESAGFYETSFPARHCGVLTPASHTTVLNGAEDEGELGAFHHAGHNAIAAAILTKLEDFLPLGMVPVLILDPRMTQEPFTSGP